MKDLIDNFKKNKSSYIKYFILAFCLGLFIVLMMTPLFTSISEENNMLSYNEFWQLIEEDKVESVTIKTFSTSMDVELKPEKEGELPVVKQTLRLSHDKFMEDLVNSGVTLLYKTADVSSSTVSLVTIIPSLLVSCLFIYYMITIIKTSTGNNSKTTDNSKIPETRFSDVAGLTEEKEELKAVLDTFTNASKYRECGGRPVKGVILEGPPGTGKTLLAKALAGEAGVNFLSYSGSDFVHLFVGAGAGKVRNMFDKARKLAPCVIFIDEIDQVGRKRNGAGGSANQEYDQTLVAMLDRLQGAKFDMDGILLIGATNKLDSIDEALLRPGRIDKIIHVGNPHNREDRMDIIKLHTKNKKLASDVTLEKLASILFGMSGAEIEITLSEAVTISFLDGCEGVISLNHIDEAYMKLLTKGLAKKKPNKKQSYIVAVHEAGHAVMDLTLGRKVNKVAIQPYSNGLGGVTVIDGDSSNLDGFRTKEEYLDDVRTLYGGLIAERVILGDATNGCGNDIDRATQIINTIVSMTGMGDSLISLKSLAEITPSIFSNENHVEKLKEISHKIEKEVTEYFSQEEVKQKIITLAERLLEEQTVYNLESLNDI